MITLKELRGESRTQEELASILGISISYYSLIENGKRRISLDLAKRLAGALGCSLDDVFAAYEVCKASPREVPANA